jgi:redox-sensitive bicupin YhaK (pirin superfamily)
MHEEMPQTREGRMEGFHLWVNLPAAQKMSRPRYQEVSGGADSTTRATGRNADQSHRRRS